MFFSVLAICIFVIVVFMTLGFLLALKLRDNSIADIMWGLGFILIALFTFFYSREFLRRQFLLTTLVVIWGLRLSLQILLRKKGKGEDPRYQKMREEWGQNEIRNSFWYVFMLQGLLMLIISLPVIYVNSSIPQPQFNMYDFIGLIIWITGFLFESIGDLQLYHFLSNPLNKGKILNTGLWRYTRHPNYFGESLMWWGIFLIALSVPYSFFTIISPLLITYLLVFVSGIPLAEKQMENNPDFLEYKKQTNAFLPWFPKK